MANGIGKDKLEIPKMGSSTGGVDTKIGFKSSKAIHDGLRGVPPKINKKQEYVCKDEDEEKYMKEKGGVGYATCLAKEEDKESDEGDDN